MNTETCPEIDPQLESEFQLEFRKVSEKCCPEIVKTACRSNGMLYKPGEKWKSLTDSCVTEICTKSPNITKHREVEMCSEQCARVRIFYHALSGMLSYIKRIINIILVNL